MRGLDKKLRSTDKRRAKRFLLERGIDKKVVIEDLKILGEHMSSLKEQHFYNERKRRTNRQTNKHINDQKKQVNDLNTIHNDNIAFMQNS